MSATIIGHIPKDQLGASTGGSTSSAPQIRSWYKQDWKGVLRIASAKTAQDVVSAFKTLAHKSDLEYSQDKSIMSLWDAAKQNHWNFSNLQGKFFCDDLMLISVCLRKAKIPLFEPLKWKFFQRTLLQTESVFLVNASDFSSDSTKLKPADILFSPIHIALVLENNNILTQKKKIIDKPTIGTGLLTKAARIFSQPSVISSYYDTLQAETEAKIISQSEDEKWYKIVCENAPNGEGYLENKNIIFAKNNNIYYTYLEVVNPKLALKVYSDPQGKKLSKIIHNTLNNKYIITQRNDNFGKLRGGYSQWINLNEMIY